MRLTPVLAAALAVTLAATVAHAQSSMGIGSGGLAEAPPATGIFGWIFAEQRDFFRSLQGALRAMRDGTGGAWALVGISLAYGVFHAAGPGHGKAVISSWMLANDVALKRGIALSFASAFAQGLTALILVFLGWSILRGTAYSVTGSTEALEIASFVLITLFGVSILWRKLGGLLRARAGAHADGGLAHAHHGHADNHHHHHHHDGHGHHDHGHAHHHHDGEHCDSCGHAHGPTPDLAAKPVSGWRDAAGIIGAIGIRPCTGAIVVLSFAFLNGMFAAGILSVAAMSFGTALTVSVLAAIAVNAKGLARRLSGESRAALVGTLIEIGGALALVILGAGLLWTALA